MNAEIYMYIERINRLVKLYEMWDVMLNDVWHRCNLYVKYNPHDYLVRNIDTNDWYIWTFFNFEDVA